MKNKAKTILIINQIDVHAARMYTREAAREIGMPLMEQACVSLATSSLAECLKMGVNNGSTESRQIVITSVHEDSRTGLRVDFHCPDITNRLTEQQIGKIKSLVDEMVINSLNGGILVSFIKWNTVLQAGHTVTTPLDERV